MRDESKVLVKGILLGMLDPLGLEIHAIEASNKLYDTPEMLQSPKLRDECNRILQQEKDFATLLSKSKVSIKLDGEFKFAITGFCSCRNHCRPSNGWGGYYSDNRDYYALCRIDVNKFFSINNIDISIDDLLPIVTNKVNKAMTRRASGIKGLFGKKETYTALVGEVA